MKEMKVQARLRKGDTLLREHFSKIKENDWPYEARRLMEKAIKIEREEKEILKKVIKKEE